MILKSELLQYICTDKICHMNPDSPSILTLNKLRQANQYGSLEAICLSGAIQSTAQSNFFLSSSCVNLTTMVSFTLL
jgi:hypothetical protein